MNLTPVPLDEINALAIGTMLETLGIEVTRVTEELVEARMPVDRRTFQIHHILHGGANAVLAETLAGIGGVLCIDRTRFQVVGVEINCNHIRSVASGYVTGVARPLHLGKITQVWDIRIEDDAGRLTCVSRLTAAVVAIKP